MWNWNFSVVVISAPKVGPVNHPASELVYGLEEGICTFSKVPLLIKLTLEMWGIGFTVFLKCAWKSNF